MKGATRKIEKTASAKGPLWRCTGPFGIGSVFAAVSPAGTVRCQVRPGQKEPTAQPPGTAVTRLPGPSVVGPQACASCTYCRRTRMHGKAARPGKTIGFLSRENYYFPRPQSLSILPNSISSFTLRASLKAFGQSSHLSPTELRLDRFRSAIGQD